MCRLVKYKGGRAVADIKMKYLDNIVEQAEKCEHVQRIMLFGSALEERCTDRSDIDIAVFGDQTKGKYLQSKEFMDFQGKVFQYGFEQDYDILYFQEGKKYDDQILVDINQGAEIFRRTSV